MLRRHAQLNQLQPAPYDGMYQFPSVTGMNPQTGKPTGTNCTICTPNQLHDLRSTDPDRRHSHAARRQVRGRSGRAPGYELVKEEDKNILIGDNYIAPVTQQFAGFGNIFILPDQAADRRLQPQQPPESDHGSGRRLPRHEGDTGSVETFWPCVGAKRASFPTTSACSRAQEARRSPVRRAICATARK